MHRILIVDEDEHLLWALEKNLFPERDELSVITTSTGEEGMEILKGGDVDLLVSDIKMPGKVDGFQLILRAKEIAPDARVVIMTAFGSGRVESFADRMGITHYIEKPFNISELRDMALDLLDEKEGFQGMLSDLELTDIIQMLCLAKRTTLLHLKHKDHRGKIVFDCGDVVHAEFDNEDGAEAVYRMLVLRQGDIFMESDVDYNERTIHAGWQDLLLEAVKRADEMRLAEGSEAEDEASGDSTPFSSFRPSESAEIDLKTVNEDDAEAEAEANEDHTDRLSGDSFFTDEELEEIGMASSEAIDQADVFEEPASEAASSDVSEASEVGDVAADGGQPLGAESSGSEVLENASPPPQTAVLDVLEEFVDECSDLRVTGLIQAGEDSEEIPFIDALKTGAHDGQAVSQKVLGVVDCARRVTNALEKDASAHEIQVTLSDVLVVVRRLERTERFHFAVVGRDASLGVVLVLMRQFAPQLSKAIEPPLSD
jgi:CheY-like chemotaxis protein